MATIRLIPSTYYLSSSTYLSVSNENNMYNNTDNDNYATVTNSQNGTTTYYIYLRGFNFDDIPSQATINSFSIKLKARESGITTNSSYSPKLCNGTQQLTSTCTQISSTTTVHTFTDYDVDLNDIKGYGDDFGIRINCRRSNRNTTGYMYIYGAEIEVNYTVPNPRTVTSTLNGDGTINPSGATNTYQGAEYELIITPTDKTEPVTVTNNGVDVTSQLVAHSVESTKVAVADNYTTSGISSGSSYASYCIGHTAEDPATNGTSSNMYSSSGSTGYVSYSLDVSNIPADAVIQEVKARCYGHAESTTVDSTHVSKVALYVGSTLKSDEISFTSTSNSIVEITNIQSILRTDLSDLTLRHTVGYYGGLVLGITVEIIYSTGTGIDHYTYTYTVSDNATIAVTIGNPMSPVYVKINGVWAESKDIMIKVNGTWQSVSTVYKKNNGTWTQSTDISDMFVNNAYMKGGNI